MKIKLVKNTHVRRGPVDLFISTVGTVPWAHDNFMANKNILIYFKIKRINKLRVRKKSFKFIHTSE